MACGLVRIPCFGVEIPLAREKRLRPEIAPMAGIEPDLPSQDTYLVKHKIREPKQLVEAES
jgi:hypothetical protein